MGCTQLEKNKDQLVKTRHVEHSRVTEFWFFRTVNVFCSAGSESGLVVFLGKLRSGTTDLQLSFFILCHDRSLPNRGTSGAGSVSSFFHFCGHESPQLLCSHLPLFAPSLSPALPVSPSASD